MISEIAYQLVKYLSTKIDFMDKWAGLVVPMRKMDGKVEKIFPASMLNLDNCDNSDYVDLIPDSKKTSICYVEKIGNPEILEIHKNYSLVSANIRLILWYNLNRISEGNFIDEGVVAANLFSQIPKTLSNNLFTYVANVNLFPSGFVTGAEMFIRYTYEEVKNQFITHPYGAVGIDINVQYTVSNCVTMIDPALKCTEPDSNNEVLPENQYQHL